MIIVNEIQESLSTLQAIPVAGPLLFSLPKAALSTAQMIAGLAVGVFSGMIATAFQFIGAERFANAFGTVAAYGFKESICGFGSLFYACLNLSTFGIAGLAIESFRRDINVFKLFDLRTSS